MNKPDGEDFVSISRSSPDLRQIATGATQTHALARAIVREAVGRRSPQY